jgi:hypothetical protein
MESIVRPFRSWDEWPDATRAFFQVLRSPKGEELILKKNRTRSPGGIPTSLPQLRPLAHADACLDA